MQRILVLYDHENEVKGIHIGIISHSISTIEWLEWLGYGAESSCKVLSERLRFDMRRLENYVNPAVNGYLFRIREG